MSLLLNYSLVTALYYGCSVIEEWVIKLIICITGHFMLSINVTVALF